MYIRSLLKTNTFHTQSYAFYCKYSFYLRFRGYRFLSFSFSLSVHLHVCCQTVYPINCVCVYLFFLLFFFVFVQFGTLLCANQSVLYVRFVCICMFHNDDVGLQFYELKRVRISNGPISFHSHSCIEPVAISNLIYIYIRTDTKYSRV